MQATGATMTVRITRGLSDRQFRRALAKLRGIRASYDEDAQTWTVSDEWYGGATGYARRMIADGYITEAEDA